LSQWGIAQWSTRIVALLLSSGGTTSQLLLRDLLGRSYHRVDPVMSEFISFDAHHRMHELLELAQKVDLSETIEFIEREYLDEDDE
jgi:hypothetical protein